MRLTILPALLLGYILAASAANLTEIQPARGYIGDPFRYHFLFEHREGSTVIFQRPAAESLHNWVLLDVKEDDSPLKDGMRQYSLTMSVSPFDTATATFPALSFILADSGRADSLSQKIASDSVSVLILSALDSLGGNAVADQYGPRSVSIFTAKQVLLLILIVLVALAALYFAFRNRHHPQPEDQIEFLKSPRTRFLEEMEALSNGDDLLQGRFKDFYEKYNYILKNYIESQYFLHLIELSTREMLPVLKTVLSQELVDEMARVLEFADMVKYAGQAAATTLCREAVDWALTLPDLLDEADQKRETLWTEKPDDDENSELAEN